MHQSNERLEKKILFYCSLMQESHQGLQGQVSVDVVKGNRITLHAQIGQQVQILHEVRPVILVWVVATFRLHQVALLIQFAQGSVLSIAAGNDLG